MRFNISEIVKENGASINVEFSEKLKDFDTERSGYKFDNPVEFTGKLENIKGIMKLTGHLNIEYTAECYRCLKEMKCSMDMKLNENFVKIEAKKDDDTYTYEGNYVELDKPVKDNILLNLPMKHVCDEACKGICSKCGCDLNEQECDCREVTIDPRMEALKDFFKD